MGLDVHFPTFISRAPLDPAARIAFGCVAPLGFNLGHADHDVPLREELRLSARGVAVHASTRTGMDPARATVLRDD